MRNRSRKGMSLVEIMVGLAVLSIMIVAVYMLIFRSSRAFTDGSKIGTIAENGRRVLDEMSNELRLSRGGIASDLIINTSYNTAHKADFTVFTDMESGVAKYRTATNFRLEASSVDANENKNSSDDWRLMRTRVYTPATGTPTTTTVVLCDYVKSGGLTFTKTGDNVVISLTLHVADDKGNMQEKVLSTSVTLRNK